MAGGILAADAGGTAVVSGTVANAGKLLASAAGGLIDIVGVVNGGVTVIGNGKVEIAGASSENVSFLQRLRRAQARWARQRLYRTRSPDSAA